VATCTKNLPSSAKKLHYKKDINPCGLVALNTVNGVDVSAETLCLLHWTFKHGQKDLVGTIT